MVDEGQAQLEFPEPNFSGGGVAPIHFLHSPDGVTEPEILNKLCLFSESGARYMLCNIIHENTFCQIYQGVKVTESSTPGLEGLYLTQSPMESVAVKVVFKGLFEEERLNWAENPLQEISAYQFLGSDHQANVMRLIECISDSTHYHSVMDYAEFEDLAQVVSLMGRLTEEEGREYFQQILNGMEFFQSNGIFHGDMSLDNIVVFPGGQCKIIDFGLCIRFPMSENGRFLPIPPVLAAGKVSHMAPENFVLQNLIYDGSATDIWSLGICLTHLLLGEPVFTMPCNSCEKFRRFFSVEEGGFHSLHAEFGLSLTHDAIDLIQKILSPNLAERPTLRDIRQHPWLTP
jgi:serine/threonine protein kinase